MTNQTLGISGSLPLSFKLSLVEKPGADLHNMIEELLTMLVEFQTIIATSNTNNDQTSLEMQQMSAAVSQANLAQSVKNLNNEIAELNAEKHESFWSTLIGKIIPIVMIVIGVLAAQPELTVSGSLMLGANLTGADNKLNQAIAHLSPALQALVQVCIDIAIAVVSCGVSGLAEAAADGAENLAARAVQKGFGQGAKEIGKTMVKSTVMATMIVNPWTNVVLAVLEAADPKGNKDEMKMIAEIAGMIISIITALGVNFIGSADSVSTLAAKCRKALSNVLTNKGLANTTRALKTVRFGLSTAQQTEIYKYGQTELAQANTIESMSYEQEIQAFIQSVYDLLGDTTQQNQTARDAVNHTLAMMMSQARLQPYIDENNPRFLG